MDKRALEWAPYKAIPADCDVWFVGWIFSSPRGQLARSVGTTSIDCLLYDPDGVWVIGWTCDLGRLSAGTYAGTETWASTVPAIDMQWSPDNPDQRTPTHYSMGVWDCTYTFTVE